MPAINCMQSSSALAASSKQPPSTDLRAMPTASSLLIMSHTPSDATTSTWRAGREPLPLLPASPLPLTKLPLLAASSSAFVLPMLLPLPIVTNAPCWLSLPLPLPAQFALMPAGFGRVMLRASGSYVSPSSVAPAQGGCEGSRGRWRPDVHT